MTPNEAARINAAARFLPYLPPREPGGPAGLPCIEIDGVQVYVYADPDRGLRIAVHADTVGLALLGYARGESFVPLEVDLDGGPPALRIAADGRVTYPAQEAVR